MIKEAVKVARLTKADDGRRHLSPVEAAQVGLVWRIIRRNLSGNWASWEDVDPFEAPSDQVAAWGRLRQARRNHVAHPADNTNLDKVRALVWPMKERYAEISSLLRVPRPEGRWRWSHVQCCVLRRS